MAPALAQLRRLLQRPGPALAAALLGVAAVTVIRAGIGPWVGTRAAFSLFFPWIFLVAWWWGAGIGIATAVVSLLAATYFFIEPIHSFLGSNKDNAGMAANALAAFICVWISARARTARLLRDQTAGVSHQLAEAEVRRTAVFSAALDCIIIMDAQGLVTDWNTAATHTFGYTREEAVGQPVAELIIPASFHAAHYAGLRRCIATPDLSGPVIGKRVELTARRKDGTEFPVELAISSDRLPGGTPFFTANLRDISSSVAARKAIAESESQLRLLSDALPALISFVTPEHRYGLANRAFHDWFGLNESEVVGRHMSDVLGRQAYDNLLPYIKLAMKGERVRFEALMPYARGGERWIDAQYVPRLNSTGGVDGLFVMVVDISDRKRAEAQRLELETRFRATFDNAAVGIAHVSPRGRWLLVNDRLCAMLGYTREELLALTFADITHPDDVNADLALMARTVQGALTSYHIEKRYIRKDGSILPADLTTSLVRTAAGDPDYFISIVQDISTAKAAAEELARHKDRLEELVTERTLALDQSNAQLRRNERMASLGTFAAGLGHDLHNSLLPLRVHVDELTKASAEVPRIRESSHAIESIVAYLGSLSRGMRLFSRDINQDSDRAHTDLFEWKLDACRFFQSSVPRDIRITCEVTPGTPRVAIAPHRLSQAVLNLVSNAGDAIASARGPAAKGFITIRAAPAPDNRVNILVTDDGGGMSEEVQRRCLEPYFTTKVRGQGGTGMGLAMVFGIITGAGGAVTFTSQPGVGTTFSLMLPAATPDTIVPKRGTAFVTLSDRRVQAFVNVVLDALHLEVSARAPRPDDQPMLWVADTAAASPAQAGEFKAAFPGSTLIVVGGEEAHTAAGAKTTSAAALSRLRTAIVETVGG